jgi:hypothetical protein
MQKHQFVVLTNSVEGSDAEFNRWYNEQHQHDVIKVPGIKNCQRFALSDAQFFALPPVALEIPRAL